MLKAFLKFLLITLALAFSGMLLVVLGATMLSDKSLSDAMVVLGGILFLFSPLLVALGFWASRRRKTAAQNEFARVKAAEEQEALRIQAERDLLRHRFLERQRLIDSVDRHRSALLRNLQRALKKNDYGALVSDETDDALVEFFASIELDVEAIPFSEARELTFEQLDFRQHEERRDGFDSTNLPFDGHAFETWVAEALNGFGWLAEVTRGSGDQGIDVIAEKAGKKLGLQCKLYGTSIGNKAVQEAHAGKAYYGLDAAGVLSNATFTASAKELATVTGIGLFSHHDIPLLFEKTFGAS
ncbi:restriction endonuclease [Rhizobium sp. NRK18]|uniref:restriction endonuclease n=1 Tax=Rhizobium sp. NRK18 TaxID=2964667 RepID=UPI0021C3C8EB|nr:restriction endonuclease [Rhizobium sp. NRK18]MCQ2004176.1 restriction endonuclease [Rhizobium sp. NRK18]